MQDILFLKNVAYFSVMLIFAQTAQMAKCIIGQMPCTQPQMMNHILESCPLIKLAEVSLLQLHFADNSTITRLLLLLT